jgi:hypothetical protein
MDQRFDDATEATFFEADFAVWDARPFEPDVFALDFFALDFFALDFFALDFFALDFVADAFFLGLDRRTEVLTGLFHPTALSARNDRGISSKPSA